MNYTNSFSFFSYFFFYLFNRNVASAIQATGTTDMSGVESKMDAQVKESKEMNQNTKKLLEQNQFLMNKLIKSNQNLALSNN